MDSNCPSDMAWNVRCCGGYVAGASRFSWLAAFGVLVLQLFLAFPPGLALARPLGVLYAFGDSAIDSGNIYLATQGAVPDSEKGYWQGRFCNGPNYLDQLAEAAGKWQSEPVLANGTNCAFAGAESGTGYTLKNEVPNLGEQVRLFFAENPGFSFAARDIILISSGHNDLLSHMDSPPDPEVVAGYVVNSITALIGGGGRVFIVPSTTPVHLSPAVRLAGVISPEAAKSWLMEFNASLDSELQQMAAAAPELTIVRTNIFSKALAVHDNPGQYGLTNVTDASYDGMGDPETYMWFDTNHVTTMVNGFYADWALDDLVAAYGALVPAFPATVAPLLLSK